MFGHQDDQSNQFQMPQPGGDASATNNQGMPPAPSMPPPIAPSLGAPSGDDAWQHPGTPLESDPPAPSMSSSQPAPVADMPDPQPENTDNQSGQDDDGTLNVQNDPQPQDMPQPQSPMPSTNDLIEIKQQALTQLSPLVGHLDQTPEEKFRTTMMMIQASDDQSMLRSAFDAAQNISDEKVRAQALLDVINEINYFTQHQPNGQ